MPEETLFQILANAPELAVMALGLVLAYRLGDKLLTLAAAMVETRKSEHKET